MFNLLKSHWALISFITITVFIPVRGFSASRYNFTSPALGIDVFVIVGQSNASGVSGDARSSPHVPSGQVLQFYKGQITDVNDPVGNAQPGSAWPAFGLTYHKLTGHRVLLVPAAAPASSLTAEADTFKVGHWNQSGALYGEAISRLHSALCGRRRRYL